ncbi:MAG: D-ribose pyranase [Spirochaetes bacterium]|nr:D-ribose pyranase [Spirochaetota bacterium]
MKKGGILNPAIMSALAGIGHTEYLVIADSGLPLPAGVEVIDLSLTKGVPSFLQVLEAVQQEFVIESYVLAKEMPEKSNPLYLQTVETLAELPRRLVSHEEFKKLLGSAYAIIRTGEATPYANVILVGGVDF